MCGIFGCIGDEKDTARITLSGLKKLEYRGYDSWGLAWEQEKKLKVKKQTGKLPTVVKLPNTTSIIGHTRWATHGGVTKLNAHPHLSCDSQIAVIHNGIVENFQHLKKQLKKKRHLFKSETDTEVIAHLIEEEVKTKNLNQAVMVAFKKLRGLNAIVVLSKGQIVAAKKGSPLVLGFGKQKYFVASDPSALVANTNRAVFLEDDQVAMLDQKGFQIFNSKSGAKVTPKVQILEWVIEEAKLGKFRHFMLKEIFEQPQVIGNISRNYKEQVEDLAGMIKKARGTFFIGCGTASYAALAGQYLLSRIADLHVNFSIGSEFNYLEHYLNNNSLVIAISQSGETIDVVEPVQNAKKKGAKVVALTNVLGSTLYRLADHKILLGAGPEVAVAATKSFIAMVSLLIYLAYQVSGRGEEARVLLTKAEKNISLMLKDDYINRVKRLAKKIYLKEHLYVIGRGLSYATALEATLKLKEVPYIHSEGFAGGELKHGVIALVEKGTPTIVFAPNDETHEAIISNAIEVKARGGYIIGVGSKYNDVFDYFLPTLDVKDASIVTNVVPAQLLAYFTALNKGLGPDKPRNLAKSVTVR
ncbi:MAG: glutamine--fructose-6-phosphate aminotransferase [Candidatus Woykebacteria bacterium RIFCSPLOWO2_01_FULL_41_12]|uniref:Glutamine--fructose-6-phosphate aminotransferase [isomerizing] n=1 Tax=Candidatus Woykebacteria bacterium RIFCSPLOWO2_01_FULL_41_12 TaxID=1802604 RepID=A0A1G1WXW8_9BACT|nr:MAG: glutamine--fructose-6-phosphate aminotransferase [Candidatus Woykebacteria bacterium RIFCSPLOWO2_01_FULL_41_12]